MAKIHGRVTLALSDSLLLALGRLGFRRMAEEDSSSVPLFKHPKYDKLFLEVARSNLPGDTHLIARWQGQNATRIDTDLLIAKLTLQLNAAGNPVRRMEGRA